MHLYNVISNTIDQHFTQYEKVTFLASKISFVDVFQEKFNEVLITIHKSYLLLEAETALELRFRYFC